MKTNELVAPDLARARHHVSLLGALLCVTTALPEQALLASVDFGQSNNA